MAAQKVMKANRSSKHGIEQPPVYSLNLSDCSMCEFATTGEMPGWIFRHEAASDRSGAIGVRGGELITEHGGQRRYRRNVEDYTLDVGSGVWRRLTDRNWTQFSVRREDGRMFAIENRIDPKTLAPRTIEHVVEPGGDWRDLRIVVMGVPVSIAVQLSRIEIIIEGRLPDVLAGRMIDEVRANLETVVQKRCIVEHL